jgi:hypothetical protein
MKKLVILFSLFMVTAFTVKVKAQYEYRTAAGLFLDAGSGALWGPSIKHYWDDFNAIQGMLLFGNETLLGAEWSFNDYIRNANGLRWNVGVGPQLAFWTHSVDFIVRPELGLEYKIPDMPFDFSLDWRPAWTLTHGSNFGGGRFGLAARFVFH